MVIPIQPEFKRMWVSGNANVLQENKYIHYNIEQAILLPSDKSHTVQGRLKHVESDGGYRIQPDWKALASHAVIDRYGRKDNPVHSTTAVDNRTPKKSLRDFRMSHDPIKPAEAILAVT